MSPESIARICHEANRAREHPLLVPYDELPDSQRVKDALFVAIVKALQP